ncbi:hypothetical protein N8482_01560, partial [Chitinophagales bacterium]|nr:hypothetical protein [Chitinophagales bacterium]
GNDNDDADGDNTPDFCDACPNSATGDSDGDGVCDDLDICAGGNDNDDADADNTPDFCDACPNSATGDSDGDGVCDDLDICPGGNDTVDTDNDNTPDFCDACPNSATGDSDGDGVCDDLDICPGEDDNDDADSDGIPDACDPINVNLIVLLEGPLDASSGTMSTALASANLLPTSSPYSESPWNLPAFTTSSLPSTAVDWILVEARTGIPVSNGGAGTSVIETRVGFLLSDGNIVSDNGEQLEFLNLSFQENYYFVVRHRNHLDVMTSNRLSVSNGMINYNFSSGMSQSFGSEQLKEITLNSGATVFVLYGGEFTKDGVVQTTDYDLWREDPSILNTYQLTDGNLDGTVQTTDFDLWERNKAKIGSSEIAY